MAATKPKAIIDDKPFQVKKRLISICASATGYTVKHNSGYIEDSEIDESDWSVYDPTGGDGAVAANTPLVLEVVPEDYIRLVGNVGTVLMQ